MAAAEIIIDEYARPVDFTKKTGPRDVAELMGQPVLDSEEQETASESED